MKKFVIALLSSVMAFGVAFSACSVKENPNSNPPGGGKEPDPVEETSITFEDFVKDHSDKAKSLYNQKLSALSAGSQSLGQYVSIGANQDDELNAVTVARTYKVDETKRKIDIVSASISPTIDLDDIVDGTVENVQYTTQTTTVFEFDVKENKLNGDVTAALYEKAGIESDLKIFSESESSPLGANVREFKLLSFADGVYTVGTLSVIDGEKTKETLLQNLENPELRLYEEADSFKIAPDGSAIIISEEYDFSGDTYPTDPENPDEGEGGDEGGETPENPDGGEGSEGEGGDEQPETFESVEELIATCNDELFEALDNTFLTRIGRAVYGQTFDAEKLVEYKWNIDNGEQISQIKFVATYIYDEVSEAYGIGKIELASVINVEELTEENINTVVSNAKTGANYTRNYTFFYNKSILGTRNDLVEAIFKACGHTLTEGSTRLFIDRGHMTDGVGGIGDAREFVVADITDIGVYEFTIRVKNSSNTDNDKEYIENLGKEGNYAVINQESQTLSGNFVTKSDI